MPRESKRNGKEKGPLATLFASGTREAVLRLFLVDPSRAYYQRQIEAATGFAIRAVQRELERLTGIDLLYRRTEGNRTYYQVDSQFALFPELRGMVLKTSTDLERLRGQLATDPTIRLAFLCEAESRVLVIKIAGTSPALDAPDSYTIQAMDLEKFDRALNERAQALEPFLGRGVDVLGRRDDVIWRRIEAAGYDVERGKGVV